jgi:hypothetical protein
MSATAAMRRVIRIDSRVEDERDWTTKGTAKGTTKLDRQGLQGVAGTMDRIMNGLAAGVRTRSCQ